MVLGLFCSDSVPLFGYRRRSYLVLSGLLGAFSWSLMAGFVDSKYSAASCILLGSLSVAFSDVVSFLTPSDAMVKFFLIKLQNILVWLSYYR